MSRVAKPSFGLGSPSCGGSGVSAAGLPQDNSKQRERFPSAG